MRKLFLSVTLTAATAMMLAGCGNKSANNSGGNDSVQAAADSSGTGAGTVSKAWPWDYPSDVKPDAKDGQTILCAPDYASNIEKGKENGDHSVYIYNQCTLVSLGDKTSKIKNITNQEYDVPNSLIIPIPEGQTAKVGDIVLTWWQGGGGMQHAIVTEASDPTQPTATFIDMPWRLNDDGTINEYDLCSAKLAPNSFFVLKDGEVTVGQRVRYPDNGNQADATVVGISGDKALLNGFADHIMVAKVSDLKPIPYHQNIKPGDKVWCVSVAYFSEGYTVDKVDNKQGIVWVTTKRDKKEVRSILQVLKSL